MRPSRLLRKLRSGEVALSAKLNFADPRVVEVASLAGFDAVWTCMEHVPNTLMVVENQVRAAKIYDVDVIVRVPRGSYSDLIRPLEMDAAGVMVPHIRDEADAREIVRQARFHPTGLRPLDGAGADGDYGLTPLADYLHQANRERMVIVQIENATAVEQVDRIAAIEGIDILFFGPGDYSQCLGIPGQFADPRIDEARRKVVRATQRQGIFAGTPCAPAELPRLIEMGYRYFNVAADVLGLAAYFKKQMVDAQGAIAGLSRTKNGAGKKSAIDGQHHSVYAAADA
ncbi:HpcH/HpaI aldolase family protein [Planctomicrobium sp. SH664]|uniref:HpcH/HpaI aldolase family protein n=1 Tax=Planctomicrobium sp. SH664 TaxID=3448125 RepID=UPI003F5C0C75